MNPIDLIEKLITERGSAEVLSHHLAFAKEQFIALERKASELERQIGNLEGKLQREQVDRDKAQQELNRLQKEHEEEIIIHHCIEFRRGKRTSGKWAAFCPKCHMPAIQRPSTIYVNCSDGISCKWAVRVDTATISQLIGELSS